MKKIIPLLFLTFILSSFIFPKINEESIVDTKWCLDGKTSTAICFKHDNTFWHYYPSDVPKDSMMICHWEMNADKVCFYYTHDGNEEFLDLQIVSCNKKTMYIKDPKTGGLIKYTNYEFIKNN